MNAKVNLMVENAIQNKNGIMISVNCECKKPIKHCICGNVYS